MPQYLVRLAQSHESFRKVELLALADVAGVKLEILQYAEDVCSFPFVPRGFSSRMQSTSPQDRR